ncbi:hypothetical protein H6P81_004654 [Aristolochia fimbriata]|uniref:Beta-carotene isomerase D27-like C-terminal domain-containing protein n=1 Tax=Aristolochia fimbriata TaxID=158543 RepID=A0AAV7EUJ6_ARIFI|nr:hypothetical protein H6P81_004654 [Aristolochia fimbriata]
MEAATHFGGHHEVSLGMGKGRRRSGSKMVKSSVSQRVVMVKAVMTNSKEEVAALEATVYHDNWFNRMAIRHLSQTFQATTGIRSGKEGYDSLVEAASGVWRNFKTAEQHELVDQALKQAFPDHILFWIRTLLPPSKTTREMFAIVATIFFYWLIGPSEVKESDEVDGRRERNVTRIKKCRFLEGSKCVGMCINLCKIPSQKFIKESFGMPITMVPNFEDMSCEMRFGQEPPAPEDDPAMQQPCYSFCELKRRHSNECSSI